MIPPQRQALYYLGNLVMFAGIITFASTFFVIFEDNSVTTGPDSARAQEFESLLPDGRRHEVVTGRGSHSLVEDHAAAAKSKGKRFVLRGLTGMGLLIAGAFLRTRGKRGRSAGSDLGANQDVNIVHEVVDSRPQQAADPEVRVRCRNCRGLNDEDAKFCDQCGESL